jgi:hypothetical protein
MGLGGLENGEVELSEKENFLESGKCRSGVLEERRLLM